METCKSCKKRKWCQEICNEMKLQIKPGHKTVRREMIDRDLYDYLIEYKVEAPLNIDSPLKDYEVLLISRLYWTDGMSPARISELVSFSIDGVVKIISELQYILEKTIEKNPRSEMAKVAVRQYFYERKSKRQIARDLDTTYLNVWKLIRRVVDSFDKNDPGIKEHIANIEGFIKNEDIQKK